MKNQPRLISRSLTKGSASVLSSGCGSRYMMSAAATPATPSWPTSFMRAEMPRVERRVSFR